MSAHGGIAGHAVPSGAPVGMSFPGATSATISSSRRRSVVSRELAIHQRGSGESRTCLGRCSFPRALRSPAGANCSWSERNRDDQSRWTTIEQVIENVRLPWPKEPVASSLSPRIFTHLRGALEGLLLFAILWVLRTAGCAMAFLPACFVGCDFASLGSFPRTGRAITGPFTRGQFLSLFLLLIGLGFFSAWIRPAFPSVASANSRQENGCREYQRGVRLADEASGSIRGRPAGWPLSPAHSDHTGLHAGRCTPATAR